MFILSKREENLEIKLDLVNSTDCTSVEQYSTIMTVISTRSAAFMIDNLLSSSVNSKKKRIETEIAVS
jgi:hypothetical protein